MARSPRRAPPQHTACWCWASLAATAAVLSGNAAADKAWEGPAAEPLATPRIPRHLDLAVGIGSRARALALAALKGQLAGWPLYAWIAVGFLIGGLVLWTGYCGSELVYVHGLGVRADGLTGRVVGAIWFGLSSPATFYVCNLGATREPP